MPLMVKKETSAQIQVMLSRGQATGRPLRSAPLDLSMDDDFDGRVCIYGVWLSETIGEGENETLAFKLYNLDPSKPYVELDIVQKTAAEWDGNLPMAGIKDKRYFLKAHIRGSLHFG